MNVNIVCSWGSGANPWGVERDEKFTKPNHWDGMLEVVGVQGEQLSLSQFKYFKIRWSFHH